MTCTLCQGIHPTEDCPIRSEQRAQAREIEQLRAELAAAREERDGLHLICTEAMFALGVEVPEKITVEFLSGLSDHIKGKVARIRAEVLAGAVWGGVALLHRIPRDKEPTLLGCSMADLTEPVRKHYIPVALIELKEGE